jgi:signal transduction histidine kinase
MRSESGGLTALELNVRASPIEIGGHPFTLVSLRDIAGEKRRQALEQIFFHDVLNTVSGLRGWTHLLRRAGADQRRAGERIDVLSQQLEREIRDHRALVEAENGTLAPSRELVRADDLLRDLETVFASQSVTNGRRLDLARAELDLELLTDVSLLLRVLSNMVRNALEATAPGGAVRVWSERVVETDGGGEPALRFCVWNEGAMPPEVQHRVFHRSFSTKARRGRGLGTYSMKLLGERYLGGRVSFISEPASGTLFCLELPFDAVHGAASMN